MKTDVLISKLDSARAAIAFAEDELQLAVAEIRVAPRAEKVAIGEVLERAFSRLRTAKSELAAAEVEIVKGNL